MMQAVFEERVIILSIFTVDEVFECIFGTFLLFFPALALKECKAGRTDRQRRRGRGKCHKS